MRTPQCTGYNYYLSAPFVTTPEITNQDTFFCPKGMSRLKVPLYHVYKHNVCTCLQGEFTDGGTETHFNLGGHAAHIRATSSGNKRKGLVYFLVIGTTELEPVSEMIT